MTDDLPVTIICDSREPEGGGWQPFFSCPSVRQKLDTGDYSLAGCGELVAIERKSLNDLVSCLTHSRDRFVEELGRGQRIKDFYVICEGSYSDLFHGRYRSQMSPRAEWESVVALQSRYSIPFLMAGGVELAARLAESILLRWFREHVKAIEAATRGVRVMEKAG